MLSRREINTRLNYGILTHRQELFTFFFFLSTLRETVWPPLHVCFSERKMTFMSFGWSRGGSCGGWRLYKVQNCDTKISGSSLWFVSGNKGKHLLSSCGSHVSCEGSTPGKVRERCRFVVHNKICLLISQKHEFTGFMMQFGGCVVKNGQFLFMHDSV